LRRKSKDWFGSESG